MQKIPTVFMRDTDDRSRVTREVTAGCEWVLAGEGIPTRKLDGTACLARGGQLYKRYDCKRGRTPPEGFEPCESERDSVTGHWPGWVPVSDGPEDKHHRAGWDDALLLHGDPLPDGTYELVGPKVNGNPDGFPAHTLSAHGAQVLALDGPLTSFETIRDLLTTQVIEGIVWHHPDGRMAKAKARDFGLKWPREKGDAP